MNKFRILLVSLVVGFSGCTAVAPVPQPPLEDRDVMLEPEVVEPTVIVSAVEDESVVQSSSEIGDDEAIEKPNKAIVPVAPSSIEAAPKNAAVVALLDSAKQQKQEGGLRSAQTSLQRAQRIAPREPEVYYDLAKVHIELEDYGLAEQVALKGVSIVQGQPTQLNRFWLLIAKIRTAAGNGAGAKKAKTLADGYL
ncbi:MAG: tetratricopeptide repeat protein [Methylophaga sp.]|nr:tetratricopeptide repeat protein [Methylophaga sp.]